MEADRTSAADVVKMMEANARARTSAAKVGQIMRDGDPDAVSDTVSDAGGKSKDKYKELMKYYAGGLVVGGAGTLIKDNLVGGRKRRRTKRKSRRRRHSRVSRTRYSSKRKSRRRSRRRSRKRTTRYYR